MYFIDLKQYHPDYVGKGTIAVSGKKRLLLSHGFPIILKDRKGLHRLWDGWNRVTGEQIKEFCGLDKEGFFALPLETEYNAFVNAATNGYKWRRE